MKTLLPLDQSHSQTSMMTPAMNSISHLTEKPVRAHKPATSLPRTLTRPAQHQSPQPLLQARHLPLLLLVQPALLLARVIMPQLFLANLASIALLTVLHLALLRQPKLQADTSPAATRRSYGTWDSQTRFLMTSGRNTTPNDWKRNKTSPRLNRKIRGRLIFALSTTFILSLSGTSFAHEIIFKRYALLPVLFPTLMSKCHWTCLR